MSESHPIVLFDGVCNLCNGAIDFIIQRDPQRRFRFASLQSRVGRELLTRHGMDPEEMSSLVLVEDGKVYLRSAGALRIAGQLRFPWNLGYVFIAVPTPLRDVVYRWIARNRYRWFGKRDVCRLPTPEERATFLGD
jgi:predicted DCC family thiol-disulfide oxidoreductase YuxK